MEEQNREKIVKNILHAGTETASFTPGTKVLLLKI